MQAVETPAKTKQVQPKPTPADGLRNLLDRSKDQIALALPKHLTPERMIRVAMTAFQQSPDLWECDLITVVGGVIQASQLGLEIGGPLGQCYLIPFNNRKRNVKEAQFIVGYKGYISLARRSGEVKHFSAHVVHANDFFDYEYGTEAHLKHKPALSERGEPTHVYSVINTKDGGSDFEVLSWEEVKALQARYKRSGDGGPWGTALDEMARKTAIRRIAKRCPVSVEIMKAANLDEYAEAGADQGLRGMLGGMVVQNEPPAGRISLKGQQVIVPTETNGHDANGNGAETQSQVETADTAKDKHAEPTTDARKPSAAVLKRIKSEGPEVFGGEWPLVLRDDYGVSSEDDLTAEQANELEKAIFDAQQRKGK